MLFGGGYYEYDKAHDLAHAMRESEEYKELMAAQEAVNADAVATGLVRTFMAQQMQWEYAKLSGAPEADELQKKQEELMPQIQENSCSGCLFASANALEPDF